MGTKKNNFSINSYDDQIMGIKIKTIFTINPYNRSNHGQKKKKKFKRV